MSEALNEVHALSSLSLYENPFVVRYYYAWFEDNLLHLVVLIFFSVTWNFYAFRNLDGVLSKQSEKYRKSWLQVQRIDDSARVTRRLSRPSASPQSKYCAFRHQTR